jgi:nucleoside-diphosphate-sugar epimerase
MLHDTVCTSTEIIKKMMLREMPILINMYLPVCDVRDVAKAHVNALTIAEAASNRHLILTYTETKPIKEWAIHLDKEFRSKNYSIPLTVAPNFVIKVASIFDKSVILAARIVGKFIKCDNSRMKNVLQVEPTALQKSLIDMAYNLIEKGIIPKKF